jgi:hypothetical protein
MRIFFYILCAFLTAILLLHCKKEQPVVPEPAQSKPCWEYFVGDYIVYDTANGFSYNMTIIHYVKPNQFGVQIDSLEVINFDNQFNIKEQFKEGEYCTDFDLGIINGIKSVNNKTFNLTIYNDNISTSYRENYLHNDTLLLYFNKENTLYWMSEGALYEDAWHTQIAVKQN